MMLGLSGKPESPDNKHIAPMRAHGLQAISIGLFLGDDTPAIWRGPMTTQYLQQLLTTTLWQDLDYLVIDLPPGTGDIQLTLAQRVPVSAAIIVTTPQDIALLDARRALRMFEKVEVPVLGSSRTWQCTCAATAATPSTCSARRRRAHGAQQYGVPLLGSLPLDIAHPRADRRRPPDRGREPDFGDRAGLPRIARKAAGRLSMQARNKAIAFPSIVVQNT
jgi:ATP-binding protein involved in chromosome partitioning